MARRDAKPPNGGDDTPERESRRAKKGLLATTPPPALDLKKIRRYRLASRKSLVDHGALGRPLHARSTFARFFQAMLESGILLPPSQFEALFVSTAHSNDDIQRTIEAAKASLASL